MCQTFQAVVGLFSLLKHLAMGSSSTHSLEFNLYHSLFHLSVAHSSPSLSLKLSFRQYVFLCLPLSLFLPLIAFSSSLSPCLSYFSILLHSLFSLWLSLPIPILFLYYSVHPSSYFVKISLMLWWREVSLTSVQGLSIVSVVVFIKKWPADQTEFKDF